MCDDELRSRIIQPANQFNRVLNSLAGDDARWLQN